MEWLTLEHMCIWQVRSLEEEKEAEKLAIDNHHLSKNRRARYLLPTIRNKIIPG